MAVHGLDVSRSERERMSEEFWGTYTTATASAANEYTFGLIKPLNEHVSEKISERPDIYAGMQTLQGISRDTALAAAIPNIGTWAKNPVMYEIGSKTLPTAKYAKYGLEGLGAIEKGKRIVQIEGWRRALTPCLRLSPYVNTIKTGLTPGGYLLGIGSLHAIDYNRRFKDD